MKRNAANTAREQNPEAQIGLPRNEAANQKEAKKRRTVSSLGTLISVAMVNTALFALPPAQNSFHPPVVFEPIAAKPRSR